MDENMLLLNLRCDRRAMLHRYMCAFIATNSYQYKIVTVNRMPRNAIESRCKALAV